MGLTLTGGSPGLAQSADPPPTCDPPARDEFLLLVPTANAVVVAQLQATLPASVALPQCDYLGNTVTRLGGFQNLEVANSWARYISQATGLQAFVARPPASNSGPTRPETATAPPEATAPQPSTPNLAPPDLAPTSTTAATTPNNLEAATPITTPATPATPVASQDPGGSSGDRLYRPQVLGSGYAVIVDFFNTPSIAQQLRFSLDRLPGLVSYGGRAYLLARYTPDSAIALQVLQDLSQQRFQVLVVSGDQTVLLTPGVQLP